MRARVLSTYAIAGALAFGAAACGGDDDEGSGSAAAGSGQEEQQQQQPEPVAQVDQLSGEMTEVELDQGFLDALEQLKLEPGTVGDATLEGATAGFPITGGNVKYFEPGSVSPFVQGRIDHDGSGLSLTSGDTEVELTDFVVDPGRSVLTGTVTANGEEAATDAPLFFLDGRTLEPLQTEGNTAILEGTTVKLKAEAADLLNDTFSTDALEEGLEIGVAKITINTQ